MANKELEILACRTIVCPNFNFFNQICEYNNIPEDLRDKAKEMAYEFLKRTYHIQHYGAIKSLFPAFLFMAMSMHTDPIDGKRKVESRIPRNVERHYLDFGYTEHTVRKWVRKICHELGIGYYNSLKGEYEY